VLELHPVPSRILAAYMLGIHLLAGISILLSGLSGIIKLLLLTALLGWFIYYLLGNAKQQVSLLIFSVKGHATLRIDNGPLLKVVSLEPALLSPLLSIILFRLHSGDRKKLIVLADSLDPDLHRQLRLRVSELALQTVASRSL